jgi:hypothetical protein
MFTEIEIQPKRNTDAYHIVLHAWTPTLQVVEWEETIETKWGERTIKKSDKRFIDLGGISLVVQCVDLEDAKKRAGEMWKIEYVGAMKQINIFPHGWGDRSKQNLLFTADNFSKFKIGSKAAEGTPF